MLVTKRNGNFESMKFDKITARIKALCVGLSDDIDPIRITQMTVSRLVNGINTSQIDDITANIAEALGVENPHYVKLSARIRVSNLHRTTSESFSETMLALQNAAVPDVNDTPCLVPGYDAIYRPKFDVKIMKFIAEYHDVLDGMIIHSRDYKITNNGVKTLIHNYLHKIYVNGVAEVFDRPQYMFMRVAVALNVPEFQQLRVSLSTCIQNIQDYYSKISTMYIMHATPTLFNACANVQQLLSCFLFGIHDDIERIMEAQKRASVISKFAGGIGIHMHQVRCAGSLIRGTNGLSTGLIPQTIMWEKLAKTWNQGGKRNGSIAIYIEPTHGDVMRFLDLKLPIGSPSERAHDLHLALWVPDLFMQKLLDDPKHPWCLFSNAEAKNLSVVYDGMPVEKYVELTGISECQSGDCQACLKCCDNTIPAYSMLYNRYEREKRYIDRVPVGNIANKIMASQRETGEPYICYKDHVNRKSNHKNIGTVQSSNLCCEIVEYSDSESYACCTLMSIVLSKYVNKTALGAKNEYGIYTDLDPTTCVDHAKLHAMTRQCVRNLNKAIDVSSYPVKNCGDNNRQLRPIAIGIQGLADLFCKLRIPFTSDIARKVDLACMETMYHAALTESMELAAQYGSYDGFQGSPMSRGILQFHMWRDNTQQMFPCAYEELFSGMYDWGAMSQQIPNGARNSLVLAAMPTVSTSQITGNNESFEPYHSNVYLKTTLAGRLTMVNLHMLKHLREIGLWNQGMKDAIMESEGSLQGLVPQPVADIYKTVWEIPQRDLIMRAAARGAFVDQAQSLNIHLVNNSDTVLRSVMRLAWQLGLKTGSYYIRTNPFVAARKNKTQSELQALPALPALPAVPTISAEPDACPIGCTSCSG